MTPDKAPRRPFRPWWRSARGALQPVYFWQRVRVAFVILLGLGVTPVAAEITKAAYADPTSRYPHGVLGDTIEYGTLVLTLDDGTERRISLPAERVFEDTAPRVQDLDGDGAPEVIAVESHARLGARLVVFGPEGEIAATPNIGTRFRWLAPVGAADLDGDGVMEVAFVDRPHLAKTLRIWRYQEGALAEVATLPGVTNHRIGEPDIAGGIRNCAGGPEMIVADAAWRRLLAVAFQENELIARDIGPHQGRASFADAMACKT